MEWETAYDAEPGSDWAPPAPAKKERRAHKEQLNGNTASVTIAVFIVGKRWTLGTTHG